MATNNVRLNISVDSKGAVKGIEAVGSASGRTATRIKEDNRKTEASFDGVKAGSGRLKSGLGSLIGIAGLGGVAFGIKDVVQAGITWQRQQATLAQSLKNTHQYSQATVKSLSDSAESLSTKGGFSAPEQLQGMTQFITQTGKSSAALKLNTATMNLARLQNVSYAKAQKLVAGAESGTPGRLSRIVGAIIPVTKYTANWTSAMKTANPVGYAHAEMLNKQATATEIVGKIQAKAGGQMSAYSKTTAGAISNAQNAIDNSMKTIGQYALPIVADIARWFADKLPKALAGTISVIKSVVGFFKQNKGAAIALGTAITILVAAFAGFKILGAVTAAWRALDLAMTDNPWGVIVMAIAAVVAGLIYAYNHCKKFRQIVQQAGRDAAAAFNWVVNALKNVIHWISGAISTIKKAWPGIRGVLVAPFNAVMAVITKIIGGVNTIISTVPKVGHFLGLGTSSNQTIAKNANPKQLRSFNQQRGELGLPPLHKARGGPISGYGGGDRVPTMLERGEYVMRKEAVANIGPSNLAAMNQGTNLGSGTGNQLPIELKVSLPVNGRALAEANYHFMLKQHARTGVWAA